jgi:hypothetical protein
MSLSIRDNDPCESVKSVLSVVHPLMILPSRPRMTMIARIPHGSYKERENEWHRQQSTLK